MAKGEHLRPVNNSTVKNSRIASWTHHPMEVGIGQGTPLRILLGSVATIRVGRETETMGPDRSAWI